MRLVFAGTPEFAERSLAALIDRGHEIALVLTRADKPAGRGHKLAESPVKQLALRKGIEVFQPASLKDSAARERIAAARPEALVVAAYGMILPQQVLDLPPQGALNVHASLLPRWRGAAPIQRALLAGDAETGVTIMRMDAGLDTGPVYARQAIPIGQDDDSGSLHDRLAALGAQMMLGVLDEVAAGRARLEAQPEQGVTYAKKIEKSESQLDWSLSANELERAVRAFRPFPGASSVLAGEPVKIWRARADAHSGKVGEILAVDDDAIVIGCGRGALVVSELQRAGGRRLSAAEFLRGKALRAGEHAGPGAAS
jgi:methionyl-tRNA formyltransferase